MNWTIVEQEETVAPGCQVPVKCKHITCYPKQQKAKNGVGKISGFGRLNFTCYRVIVEHNDSNKQVTIVLSIKNGEHNYTVTNPSKIVPQYIKIGKRKYEDRLAPKVTKAGDKRRLTRSQFMSYILDRFGAEVATQIMFAFASRVGQDVGYRKAA